MSEPSIPRCTESIWPRLAKAALESLGGEQAMDYLEKIRAGDSDGIKELYGALYRGIRFLLWRHLGPQPNDDEIRKILAAAAQQIRLGRLCDQFAVVEFVWAQLERTVHGPERLCAPPPEPVAAHLIEGMQQFLLRLSRKNREAFWRFYLLGQSPREICLDLNIGEGQFRMLRVKAKARFAELWRAPA